MKLVIASKNVHKVREIRSILKKYPLWDVYSLMDFPHYSPPEENGLTFEDNAILKASHAARELNTWVLADDSGLIVPALGGEPGVRSARYAGETASDKDNRKKLLEAMHALKGMDREAYFECALALCSPEMLEKCVSARCEGRLVDHERGGGGFGYDPLFIKHDYNKTFAELDEEVKNRISHRRKALDKMLVTLEALAERLSETTT